MWITKTIIFDALLIALALAVGCTLSQPTGIPYAFMSMKESASLGTVSPTSVPTQEPSVVAREISPTAGRYLSSPVYGDYPWANSAAVASLTSPVSSSKFGNAVAMSDDYLVVGAFNIAESVYIYERSDDTGWNTTVLNTFTGGSGTGKFGSSVAISSTGRYVIVGAPGDNEVYIFTQSVTEKWTGTSVTNITATLTGNAGSNFGGGDSVAITDHYAVVGAYSEGKAYVYENNNGWSATPVISISAYTSDAAFGYSISMTDSYILIGCADDSGNGAMKAYIFEKGSSGWSTTASTTISSYTGEAGFGMSVHLNNQFAVIGAYSARKAFVFRYDTSSNTWPTIATTGLTGYSTQPDFGSSVSIRSDSEYLIVGAAGAKKAFIFQYLSSSNTFHTAATTISSTTPKFGGESGGGVAFSNHSLCVGSVDGAFLYDQYCSAGTYNALGRTSAGDCTDCSAGYYISTTGNTSCDACVVGTYQLTTGGTSCNTCNVGKYAENTASSSCTQCPSGTYTDLIGSSNCTDCPSNYYSPTLGASQLSDCLACANGTFSQAGSSVCSSLCTAGSWFDGTTCVQCNPGKYNPNDGSTESRDCILCEVGKYGFGSGNSVCTDCTAGTYNDETGEKKPDDCRDCSAGKYSNAGAEVCTSCPAGSYEDDTGQAVCTSCAAGKYNANIGSSVASDCLNCPVGRYAATTGSAVCTKCEAGKANGNTGSALASACVDCAIGYYAVEGSETCTACADGQTTGGAGSGVALTSCTACAAGTYSSVANTGMVCTACDAGFFSNDGATECTICPLGSIAAVAGSAVCTECPIATYSDAEGALACTACPGGRITPGLGAVGVADCVSPEVNFITAFVIIVIVIPLAMEYIVHARFVRLAFLRQERITFDIVASYKYFSRRLWKGLMNADAERLMNTRYMSLKTVLFLVGSIFLTGISALINFVLMMTGVFFKSMIVWRGLNISMPFEDIMNKILGAFDKWTGPLLGYLFYPFIQLFDLVVVFEIDLESVDITCKGSSAPLELFINLIVLGLCIVIIDSEFNIFKGVTWASLAELHLEQVTAPTFRKWAIRENGRMAIPTVMGYIRYCALVMASFGMLQVMGIDIFQGFLQYCMSSLTIISFFADNGKHAYSPECNNVDNYKEFDSLIAGLASGEFWLLVLPAVYEISKLLLPGISQDALSNHFLAMLAQNVDKKASPQSSYFHLAKYSSLCNPDLWIAAFSEHWLRYIDANLMEEVGKNVKSMRQQQLDDQQEEDQLMCMSMTEYMKMEQVNLQPQLIAPTASESEVEEHLPIDYGDIQPPYRPLFRVIVGTASITPNIRQNTAQKDFQELSTYRGNILQSRGGYIEKNRVYSTIPPEVSDDYVYNEREVCMSKVDRRTGLVMWRRIYKIDKEDFEEDPILPNTSEGALLSTTAGTTACTSTNSSDMEEAVSSTMRRESRVDQLTHVTSGNPSVQQHRVRDLIADLDGTTSTDLMILYATGRVFGDVYENSDDSYGMKTRGVVDDEDDKDSSGNGADADMKTLAQQLKAAILRVCPLIDWNAFTDSYGFVLVNVLDSPPQTRTEEQNTRVEYDFSDIHTSSEKTQKSTSFFQYTISDCTETVDLAFEMLADGFSIPHQMPLHRNQNDSFFFCCLNRKSKLLASLQLRSPEEDDHWKHKQKAQMPSYLTLCEMEYNELIDYYEKPIIVNDCSHYKNGSGTSEHRQSHIDANEEGNGSDNGGTSSVGHHKDDGDYELIDVVVENLGTPVSTPRNHTALEQKEGGVEKANTEKHVNVTLYSDLDHIDIGIDEEKGAEREKEKEIEIEKDTETEKMDEEVGTRRTLHTAPLIVKWFYIVWVFFGFGHICTRIGREAWYMVGHKYMLFLLTCLGIWTTDAAVTLGIKGKVDEVTIAYDKPYVARSKAVYLKNRQRLKRPIERHSWVYAMLHPEESKVYQWVESYWYNNDDHKSKIGNDIGLCREDKTSMLLAARTDAKDIEDDMDRDGIGEPTLEPSTCADDDDNNGDGGDDDDLDVDGREYPDAYYEGRTLRTLQQEELKRKYRQDTAQMLYEVIATRAVLLQIIPSLALLSIYASTMSNTPLYVFDKELATNLPELIVYDPFGEALAMEEEAIRDAEYIRQNLDVQQNKVKNPHYIYHKEQARWISVSLEQRDQIEMRNRYFELLLKRAVNPHVELTMEEMKTLVNKGKNKSKKKKKKKYESVSNGSCGCVANRTSELCSICYAHCDDTVDSGKDEKTTELSHEAMASLCEHSKETPDMWIVLLEGMNIYFNHSRLINLFYNLFTYVLVLALILAPSEQLEMWIVAAIIILFPYCIFDALELVIVIGKGLCVSDQSIEDVLKPIRLDWIFVAIIHWIVPKHRRFDDSLLKEEREEDVVSHSSAGDGDEHLFSDVSSDDQEPQIKSE